jgi:hypothetical protein
MMNRLAVRIAGLTLAGVVMACGWGGDHHAPDTSASERTVATVAQEVANLFSPATAQAATCIKPPKKKQPSQTTPKRAKPNQVTTVRKAVAAKKAIAAKKSTPAAKQQKSAQTATPRKTIAAKAVKTKKCALNKKAAKNVVARKEKTRTKTTVATVAKGQVRKRTVGGRCEPQSLTYARGRSGIMRSRNGRENGPLTWFAAEQRLGKTTDQPAPGSVLILGSDRGHGMTTGHVAFVEKAIPSGPSRYKLLFSHTNYDRKCSLETNIEAIYNSSAKTLDIFSGAWQPWGRGLRVAGFIQQE